MDLMSVALSILVILSGIMMIFSQYKIVQFETARIGALRARGETPSDVEIARFAKLPKRTRIVYVCGAVMVISSLAGLVMQYFEYLGKS